MYKCITVYLYLLSQTVTDCNSLLVFAVIHLYSLLLAVTDCYNTLANTPVSVIHFFLDLFADSKTMLNFAA